MFLSRFRLLFSFVVLSLLVFNSPSSYASTCDPALLARGHAGDVNVQSYIAHLYVSGKEVDRDYQKARYWYQRVIDHQKADARIVAHANLLLGLMYNNGKGGEQSYSTAMKCFRIAAKQGYFDAHISIGHLYAKGLGVPQDYRKALYWWKLAAEKGHPRAPNLVRLLKKEMAGQKTS